jgi:prophage tail gpP-like protein
MRRPDKVKVEAVGVGTLETFTSFALINDLLAPSEASFEIGDDGTWAALEKFIATGTKYRVFLNGALRLTGRVELRDVPIDLQGSVVRFTVRTKLADAMYASADPRTKITGVSVARFLLDLFEPLGYTDSDFIFDTDLSRNLMTGVSRYTGKAPANFEKLREDQARVNPPETIFQAAARHLMRFGLMIWDSPDGKLVVGAPNDAQAPLYYFRMLHGKMGRENNLLSANRINDMTESATLLGVFGVGAASGFAKARIKSVREDAELVNAGFYRPVIIIQNNIQNQALADRQVLREMTNRNKKREVFDLRTDGLSWWNGNQSIPFGIDTVCDITTTAAGGPAGAHLIIRTECTRTANEGDQTRLLALKKGLWVL